MGLKTSGEWVLLGCSCTSEGYTSESARKNWWVSPLAVGEVDCLCWDNADWEKQVSQSSALTGSRRKVAGKREEWFPEFYFQHY